MHVNIRAIAVGDWKVNCYLVAIGNEGWLIDPGDEIDKIVSALNLDNYKLKGIINTHGHFDHIGAVADIKDKYNISFSIHSKDRRLVSQGNLYRRMVGSLKISKTPVIDNYLNNNSSLKLEDKRIVVHHTPGHTDGSVCFEIDRNLLVGDLFFENNLGISNLPGGNKRLLLNSINYICEKFIGYQIYPGHGEPFVLEHDQMKNLKE